MFQYWSAKLSPPRGYGRVLRPWQVYLVVWIYPITALRYQLSTVPLDKICWTVLPCMS
jgi:hypothetical protein